MDWIKLTVTTTNEASEAVINLLMENGAGGVEIDDSDLSQVELATYFQAQAGLVELLPELEQKIAQLREFGLDPGKGTVKLAELDDDSWADVWKKYYHPVRLTRYLTIVPSWESYTPETIDEKVIKLDPGRAFGTGTHPTTKLALSGLDDNGSIAADEVAIGKTVVFQEEDDEPETYQIVGAAEADPFAGKISNESPIAQSLVGHKVGETVSVETPGGEMQVKIIEVK